MLILPVSTHKNYIKITTDYHYGNSKYEFSWILMNTIQNIISDISNLIFIG